jgi:hypothetical protein
LLFSIVRVPPPSWSRTCAYQQPLPPCRDFVGLHIEYLGDSALHNKKVRVINVQLHRERVLDLSREQLRPLMRYLLFPPSNT